jgi:hypothetical protein
MEITTALTPPLSPRERGPRERGVSRGMNEIVNNENGIGYAISAYSPDPVRAGPEGGG